jgi:ABC-type proline/glycine betaine transport system permease subunit
MSPPVGSPSLRPSMVPALNARAAMPKVAISVGNVTAVPRTCVCAKRCAAVTVNAFVRKPSMPAALYQIVEGSRSMTAIASPSATARGEIGMPSIVML